MRRNLFGNGRGRLLAIAGVLVVSAGMFYVQGPEPGGEAPAVAAAVDPQQPQPAPAGAPFTANPEQAEMLVAAAPPAAMSYQIELPAGVAPEGGLQKHTIWVARAISAMFPEIKTIGGYRQDPLQWHPNGLAIDVMIPNHGSEAGIELGNQVAGLALANAERWGVLHVIWRQGLYPGIGAPQWTADYGNETANHFDHVHIATDGGGFPTGNETYFFDSMK